MNGLVVLAVFIVMIFTFKAIMRRLRMSMGEDSDCPYCGPDCDCECEKVPATSQHITQNIYRNRNGRRVKIGVLVSCCKNGNVKVGYSVCHKTDNFDSKEAYVLAGQRMSEKTLSPPQSIKYDLDHFIERCHRYYKGANVATFDGFNIVNP